MSPLISLLSQPRVLKLLTGLSNSQNDVQSFAIGEDFSSMDSRQAHPDSLNDEQMPENKTVKNHYTHD